MHKRVFAIAAHPDDIEFLMAGTLILLKEADYEIHYMTIANGSCGTSRYDAKTIIKKRREESIEAAKLIGAKYHESLVNDLEIFYERDTLFKLSAIIREVAPNIILTHSPVDYMEDHMNTSRLVVSAAFSRGLANVPVIPQVTPIKNDITIYHAQPHCNRDYWGNLIKPEIFVDISSVMNKKIEMLSKHESQKEYLEEFQGMDSYVNAMKDISHETGRMSDKFEFAEGFRKRFHIGYCSPKANPLIHDLGDKFIKYLESHS